MLITHRADTLWRYGQVETALCLWEAVVDMRTAGYAKVKAGEDPGDSYRAIENLFNGMGSFGMRAVIASIVPECDRAWEAKQALLGSDHDEAFDFDFCPQFIDDALGNGLLSQALDWQHTPDAKIGSSEWTFPLDGPKPPMTAAA
jgi:hypothetical protein